jgi:hypothetical protein
MTWLNLTITDKSKYIAIIIKKIILLVLQIFILCSEINIYLIITINKY